MEESSTRAGSRVAAAVPGPPWPRFWLVLNGIWAVTPAAIDLWASVTLLPGEVWALEFLMILAVPLWGVVGLLLWGQLLVTRTRARGAVLVTPAALLVGAGILLGVRAIPRTTFLPYAAGRAFARAGVPPDAEVVAIDSDRAYDAHGRFVREDPDASNADSARLPLGLEAAPWSDSIEVPRRVIRREEVLPAGYDLLLAVPLKDGWWYVYTAH